MDNLKRIKCNYEDIKDISYIYEEAFFISIKKKNVEYEFIFRLKNNNDKLIIFGSGANNPDKIKPPVFHRYTWANDFEENLIFYNDPTLHKGKINLGWGQGDRDVFYLEEIARILDEIVYRINIPKENIKLYGSSGGGFTAMIIGSSLKAKKVVVNNPQINILNYYKSHVRKMMELCYEGMSEEEMLKQYTHRLNVIEYYKKNGYIPQILYLQNTASKDDMEKHLIPFINGIKDLGSGLSNNIRVELYYNKVQGHNPLDKEETIKYLAQDN